MKKASLKLQKSSLLLVLAFSVYFAACAPGQSGGGSGFLKGVGETSEIGAQEAPLDISEVSSGEEATQGIAEVITAEEQISQGTCVAAMPDRQQSPAVFLEDIVDGQVGEYRLVSLEQTLRTQLKNGKIGSYTGRTTLSPKVNPKDITATQELLCVDNEKLTNAELKALSGIIPLPLVIKRQKGQVTKDLVASFIFSSTKDGEKNVKKTYSASQPRSASFQLFQRGLQEAQLEVRYYRTGKEDFEVEITGETKSDDGSAVISGFLKATYQFVPAAQISTGPATNTVLN